MTQSVLRIMLLFRLIFAPIISTTNLFGSLRANESIFRSVLIINEQSEVWVREAPSTWDKTSASRFPTKNKETKNLTPIDYSKNELITNSYDLLQKFFAVKQLMAIFLEITHEIIVII